MMGDKGLITTQSDFKLFKSEILKWQIKYGLIGWCLYFVHEDIIGGVAQLDYDMELLIFVQPCLKDLVCALW